MDSKNKTVVLHRFTKNSNGFCSSPFVDKLDALLTFSGAKIVYKTDLIYNAPRGQLPFITLDGASVPDSELAYDTCVQKGLFKCLDKEAGLTDDEFANSHSLRILVEKSINVAIVYERWVENYAATRDKFVNDIPMVIRVPIGYFLIWRSTNASMWANGYGRHSESERSKLLENDVRALAIRIPKSGYILGKDRPTKIDATVFGCLISIAHSPELCPKIVTELHKYPHIQAYTKRIVDEFWPSRDPL